MPLAPVNPAVEDDEEDQLPVAPAPVKKPGPRIGSTGGVIPEQQSEIDARTPVQWSPDPMERQQQVQQEIETRRQASFQKEHPFTPSSWRPKINTPDTRREDREFAGDAESQFQYQQQTARATAVAQKKSQIAQRNAKNDQLEAEYRGSGQQFYADSGGNLKPVIETESGRALFHATGWEAGTHPQTGAPTLTMRDKYGQRQFKAPPVVASLDPSDDQMYYKLPDGTTAPAGSIDDFAKHPNYTIAKAALSAKTRQVKAIHQEALQPMKLIADQSVAAVEDAKVEIQGLDDQIEKLSMQVANATAPDGSPTPRSEGLGASLAQLQAKRDQLDGMVKPRGELAQRAARAKAGFAIASATAMREAFLSQQAEIAARVKSQGGNLESDPTYLANLRGLRSAEQILGGAEQDFGGTKAAPTAAPVGQPAAGADNRDVSSADPLQQSEPYIASQNGVKNIGSVKMDEFARRYGDGRGPVKPDQLIKLQRRSKEIEAVLGNDDSSINQTMRDQMTKEKDYIDSLAKQRFARLPEEQQKRVTEVTRDPTWWDKIKGGAKSLAEEAAHGGGAVLKGLAQIPLGPMGDMEGGRVDPEIARKIAEANATPQQRMENVKSNPVYQLGTLIQDSAKEFYQKSEHEDEGGVAKAINAAAGAAGGFVPLVGSGPMAPITMGLQTAGDEMQRIYDDQIKKGIDPQRAADFAQKRALATGAVQAALFEILPKPLQKAGNKLILDKIAGGALKKFIANRVAQGVEGGVMGGTAAVAGNVAAGRPAGEGVAEGAEGLGVMQAVMPRAGGTPKKSKGGEPAPKPEPKAPLTPEQQAAEAEFQKADAKMQEPAAGFEAKGAPSTAAEAAKVLEPALKEKENTPPPSKSAEESAAVMQDAATTEEASAKVSSQQEEKIQKLVDQISESSGKSREEILSTRAGRDPAEWTKELESDAKYHANPLVVDPDRRITELKAENAKLDEDWAKHLDKTAAEAEVANQLQGDKDKAAAQFKITKDRHDSLMERRSAIEGELAKAEAVRKSPQGAAGLKDQLATEEQTSAATARELRTPDLTARRDAIEQRLAEAERVRQSNKGGEDLRKDLAAKEGRPPPDEPPAPAFTTPATPPKSPLGDQAVKLELRRATGDTVEVQMPARVAEKRVTDHISTLEKVLNCLKGVT